MIRILSLLALTLLLGCSGGGSNIPDAKKQSGDLGAFILQQASKAGAQAQQTTGLPPFTGEWSVKDDGNSCQIYIVGDHFAQLHSFLTAAFGPPPQAPMTNAMGDTKHVGTFYGPQLGAALSYNFDATADGKQFTTVVIAKPSK